MRLKTKVVALVLAAAAFAVPAAFAAEGGGVSLSPYAFGHIGMFDPGSDIKNTDSGLAIQGGIGGTVAKNVGVEAAIGYFGTGNDGGGKVYFIPVTIGAKAIARFDRLEPYAGVGFGFYMVDGRSDSSIDLGWYLGAGVNAWLSDNIGLSVDYRHHMVKSEVSGRDLKVAGDALMIGFTYRK